MIPFGEYMPDQPKHEGGGSTIIKNVYPALSSYLPLPRLEPYSDALDDYCRGGIFTKSYSGNIEAYAGTATKLYKLGQTVTDVAKAGDYSLAQASGWGFADWGDKVIAVNRGTPTQIITKGASNFGDLVGAPSASHIAIVKEQIVLGNLDDGGIRPNVVKWSGLNNETQWTAGTNQSGEQTLLSGGDVMRVVGGDYGVIFMESAIYRMDYVGTPLIYTFNEVEPARGTLAGGSVAQYGRSIFYLGLDGFYELIDGSYSKPIGHEKVNRTFLADLDSSFYDRISASIDIKRNLVVWTYAGVGNTNGGPNKAIIYNWSTERWSFAEFDSDCLINGASFGETLESLDSFGDMDSLPFSLDSSVWKGGNLLLGGFTPDHRFGFMNGEALSAVLDTSEFGKNDRHTIHYVRPYIEGSAATNIQTQIIYRNQLTEPEQISAAYSLDETGKANTRINARYKRIRLNITGGFHHAKGVEAKLNKTGLR